MLVAVLGDVTHGELELEKYIPADTTAIIFIRGQYVGECAERYADGIHMAKCGVPELRQNQKYEEPAAYASLTLDVDYLLLFCHNRTWPVQLAIHHAKRKSIPCIVIKVSAG